MRISASFWASGFRQKAQLRGATGLTTNQIDLSLTDANTQLPDYLEEELEMIFYYSSKEEGYINDPIFSW
jgi:hypothetical protein